METEYILERLTQDGEWVMWADFTTESAAVTCMQREAEHADTRLRVVKRTVIAAATPFHLQ